MTLEECFKWRPVLCECTDPTGPLCSCGRRQENTKILSEIDETLTKNYAGYVSDTEWLRIWGHSEQEIFDIYANIGKSFKEPKNEVPG